MAEQPFDVRKVIDQSASKTTLQELAKKGIHRVKVLDEQMINKLIKDAVEHILVSKTSLLSDTDREKVIAASRKELDTLIKEFNQQKDKAELAAQDKTSLAAEVENLSKQLNIQRQLSEQLGRQRYEDGKRAGAEEVDRLKERMGKLDDEVTSRVKRDLEGEMQRRMAAEMEKISHLGRQMEASKAETGHEAIKRAVEKAESELKDQFKAEFPKRVAASVLARENELKEEFRAEFPKRVAAAVQARENEMKAQFAEREKELRSEADRRYEEGIKSQKPVIEQMEHRIDTAAKTAAMETEQIFQAKVMAEMEKNVQLSQRLAQSLEDSRAHEDLLTKKMETLFTKSLEGLSKKLSDLRMRSFASGSGGGGGGGGLEAIELRPSQATLEGLFSQELESNVKGMEKTEGKVSGKLGSALDKLKAMRGGGAPKPPAEGEKK